MKFLQLLLFFNALTINALEINNSNFSTLTAVEDTLINSHDTSLKELFEKGISEYSNYKYNKAIATWKQVLQKANTTKDSSIIIKTNINIGSGYNALGYHKTALSYFLKSAKIFESYHIKNESYWANHLNIGVCYMSLEQYDLAKKYFKKTAAYNAYIVFLKKLNFAKWHALQNEESLFIAYQKDLSQLAINFPIYVDIWNEMQLDFFIKWKNIKKVKELIDQLTPIYKQQNLYLKLLINQGYLLVYQKAFTPLSNIHSYAPEVISSNDLYLTSLYYTVLKEQYYALKDLENYHYYSGLWDTNNEALNEEKNMMHVEDYKTAQELEELKGRFSEIELKNALIQNQLSKSSIKFKLSLTIIVMGFGIIYLIIRNYRKEKKINHYRLIRSKIELEENKREQIELSSNLTKTKDELNESLLNIKKVALLKKQLENIIESKEKLDEKEILIKLKVCLNSFFDNYRELNELIQKKLNVEQIIAKTKKDYPTLTEKELNIIELIILQFTTKEIALLSGKSEKSIEYYRTQIRKKMKISNDKKLEIHLISL